MRFQLSAIVLAASLLVIPAVLAAPAPPDGSGAPAQAAHKRAVHKPATSKRVTHKKRRISRHWHGYGFLPGYVPPEVAARERAWRYWANGPRFYGPAWPRFYRGRWNGGGFGPCYVQTPIGYMWTCGK